MVRYGVVTGHVDFHHGVFDGVVVIVKYAQVGKDMPPVIGFI